MTKKADEKKNIVRGLPYGKKERDRKATIGGKKRKKLKPLEEKRGHR